MKPHRFPLIFLALLPVILFIPSLLRKHVFVFRDHLDFFQPLRWFTASELRDGRIPFWNPFNGGGEPWMANPQTGVFYPPQWLFVALPFETAYMLYLLVHLILLGCGGYLLFARRASSGAAMVGGAALMFAGPTLSLLDVSNNLATYAWIPLVILCGLARAPIAGAYAMAMAFLAAEPFFAAVAAVLFVVANRNVRDVLIAGLGAFGLSAIQLFPFLELIRGSNRAAGLAATEIFRDSMPLRDWLHLARFPTLDAAGFDPRLGQHFIPIVYVSVFVVLLALIGVAASWRRRDVHAWLALLACAIVVGSGPRWLAELPVTLFRYPARMVPLGALAVIALAVIGWDRIGVQKRWIHLMLVLVVVGDLLPRAWPLLRTQDFRAEPVPYPKIVGSDAMLMRLDEVPTERIRWISGYLNIYDHRFDASTPAPVVSTDYVRFYRRLLESPDPETLRFSSIGWVLSRRRLAPPFRRTAQRSEAALYRYPDALPIARVEGGAAFPLLGTRRAFIDVETATGGLVVVAQRDAPGWRVRVDGVEREKRLAGGMFRAVEVPPGRHRVEWTYHPRAFFFGAAVTMITLFATLFFMFVKHAREEKFFFLRDKK